MSFWLQESLFFVFMRGFSLRNQLLITILVGLLFAGFVFFYKSALSSKQQKAPIALKALKVSQQKKRAKFTHSRGKFSKPEIDSRLLPQALHLFLGVGFRVKEIEQVLERRTKKLIGYLVRVDTSFDLFMEFLNGCEVYNFISHLSVRSIERKSNVLVEIEFLIRSFADE